MYRDDFDNNRDDRNDVKQELEENIQTQEIIEETTNNHYNYYPNEYPSRQENRLNYSHIPEEPNKKKESKKKESGFFRKAVAVVSLGVLFGVSAGVSYKGIDSLFGADTTTTGEVSLNETPTVTTSENGTNTSQVSTVLTTVTDVTEVVDNVMPSVVSITNTAVYTQSFFGQQYQSESESSGSGIIVGKNDTELLIVTNNHVIADSNALLVQFIDGSVAEAKIKGTDATTDLAVVAVDLSTLESNTLSSISIAVLGDSAQLKVGEPAIAIGNALGYGQSVTTGVISALDRQIEISESGSTTGTLIQTDAAINPGNSGGALLNVKGEVIGINSNKIGGSTIEGMGYAIPISTAKPIIEELMSKVTKDKVAAENKGYLGISGINVTSDVSQMYGMPEGVYVSQVYEHTGASTAGLMQGDIITGFDGSKVSSMEQLQGYLEYYEKGAQVEVIISRGAGGGYTEHTVTVTLGAQAQVTNQNPQVKK
ncbi:MAG: S1C family serine protease [Lachnospiraceae bacterium]